MIESHLREEVLYREGLALGLDQNDTIIRRRLAQKMEFLFEDLADQVEPTDEELKRYFDKYNDKYLLPARVSFSHIYFNVDRHGEAAYGNAKQLLKKLQSHKPSLLRASDQGDRFMLEYDYAQKIQQEVANVFVSRPAGSRLALAAASAAPNSAGRWRTYHGMWLRPTA